MSKAHAKLSASGSERWLNCPGSIKLSEDAPPQEDSIYAKEGTIAHDYLDKWLFNINILGLKITPKGLEKNKDMFKAVKTAVDFVLKTWKPEKQELFIEEKIELDYIIPEGFGTSDINIVELGETLQVWDYKHGAGHVVEVAEKSEFGGLKYNTQLMYYLLGSAYKHDFKFKKYLMGIIQPRAGHDKGPIRYSILDRKTLSTYEDLFKKGVDRVFSSNPRLYAGRWCKWCPAFDICPKQESVRQEEINKMFEDF